jgi:alcohol dehydrogenase (cytochrome c)/quinohemoprotein ethanol dehydrogenase
VVDRQTGQFIKGKNFVPMNWATGLDPKTGRPIENPEARFDKTGKPFVSMPGAGGAHSWQPMAYDPRQKLMFIPANIAAFPMCRGKVEGGQIWFQQWFEPRRRRHARQQ